MSRLIDADDFDRWLANAEFTAALNNADDNDRPFKHEAMYYSTQSFRDVMSHRPTIDAIPISWIIAWYFKRYMETEVEVSVSDMIEAWWKEQEASKCD